MPLAPRGWLFPPMRSGACCRAISNFPSSCVSCLPFWKCNPDCHYCWAFDNRVKGGTEVLGRRSIDWLFDHGCRVLALMAAELPLRPQLVHKVVSPRQEGLLGIRAHQRPTGLWPDIIGGLGDAGVATFNLTVDAVDEKKGLGFLFDPHPELLPPSGVAPVPLRLHGVLQQEYLPSNNPGRRLPFDRDRPRPSHRHGLSHQRNSLAGGRAFART